MEHRDLQKKGLKFYVEIKGYFSKKEISRTTFYRYKKLSTVDYNVIVHYNNNRKIAKTVVVNSQDIKL